MVRVAILWHMHQPLYRNPVTGTYELPWTRLHALKDYYGMVKLTEEFPTLRLTFNLVPSLVAQIQDYAEGRARDPYFDAAAAPVEQLGGQGREFVLRYFFQAQHETMIGRYPRYAELLAKFRQDNCNPRRGARHFTDAELRDLQVLSQLAWVDEFWLQTEPARSLARQGRDFSREDQEALCAAQRQWIAAVLPEYRRARERGQIEISTTPYYHPILPLLCDSWIAKEAHPGVHLPHERFRFPEDAREQLLRARRLHVEVFGAEPCGLWPSEGSISAEVAELAAGAGFRWMASDETVLAKSLNVSFARDARSVVANAELLYAGHALNTGSGPITIFFRDHQISDLIGFVYARMPAEQAADNFMQRVAAATAPVATAGHDALVVVILDGENAWESFPASGRAFLRALYRRLTSTPGVTTCTFSEAAQLPVRPLPRLAPGSWINGNFDIWIGDEEDNRSWDLLQTARQTLRTIQEAGPDLAAPAHDDLLAAEGSDWNWWYGPQHHSENAAEFDALYRALLSDAYTKMGRTPPAILSLPIARGIAAPAAFEPASGWVQPRIDGRISSYFEWLGAAVYRADPRTGAMHGKEFRFSALYAGYDAEALYLRLDFIGPAHELRGELRFEFSAASDYRLAVGLEAGKIVFCRFAAAAAPMAAESGVAVVSDGTELSAPAGVEVALNRIFELRIPRAMLGVAAPAHFHLHLRAGYWSGGLPSELLPTEGSLDLPLLASNAMQAE